MTPSDDTISRSECTRTHDSLTSTIREMKADIMAAVNEGRAESRDDRNKTRDDIKLLWSAVNKANQVAVEASDRTEAKIARSIPLPWIVALIALAAAIVSAIKAL